MSPALVTTPQGQRFAVFADRTASMYLGDGSVWIFVGTQNGFTYHTDGKGKTKEFGWQDSEIEETGAAKNKIVYLPDGTIIEPAINGSKKLRDHILRKEGR